MKEIELVDCAVNKILGNPDENNIRKTIEDLFFILECKKTISESTEILKRTAKERKRIYL